MVSKNEKFKIRIIFINFRIEYTIYLNSMIELYESNASIKYVDAQQLGEYQVFILFF